LRKNGLAFWFLEEITTMIDAK